MDEEDGRPGACSRQFGPLSALPGVALQSLFQHFRARFFGSAAKAIPRGLKPDVDNAGPIGTTEVVPLRVHPSGAKALVNFAALAARLKSCPDTSCGPRRVFPQPEKPSSMLLVLSARLKSCPFKKPASPLRGFAGISHPYPTLKRGANNRGAYGALGTTEVVPYYKAPSESSFEPFQGWRVLSEAKVLVDIDGRIGTRPTHCVGTPVVPFHETASLPRGFAGIRPYPTLKRGANNRGAYGALGTMKSCPITKRRANRVSSRFKVGVSSQRLKSSSILVVVSARDPRTAWVPRSCPFTKQLSPRLVLSARGPDNVWILRSCPFTT